VIAVPSSMVEEILENNHDRFFAGHMGFKKTACKIRERFYWPRMTSDIYIHCNSCLSCAGRKPPPAYTKVPLVPIVVTDVFDMLGPFHMSENDNKYIIVFCEYLTRWPESFSLPNVKAETVAKVFVENIVCRFGAPKKLLSDCGSNFLSNLGEICRLCGTTKINTVPYHPQADGLVERFNRTITDILSMYVSSNQRDWDTFIPYALFAYRTAKNESTNFPPFYLMHGRQANLPIDAALNAKLDTKYIDAEDYADNVSRKLTTAWCDAKSALTKAQKRQKKQYDSKKTGS